MLILVAEFGDLTQIMTANLAARYDDPLSVGLGAVLALWAVAGLGIVGGKALMKRVPLELITKVAAMLMLALGSGVCTRRWRPEPLAPCSSGCRGGARRSSVGVSSQGLTLVRRGAVDGPDARPGRRWWRRSSCFVSWRNKVAPVRTPDRRAGPPCSRGPGADPMDAPAPSPCSGACR